MTLSRQNRGEARKDRSVGNIYDRLEDARRQRERALDTPSAANDDRPQRAFPRLKPPADFPPETAPQPSLAEWAAPFLIALAIFAVIFVYAVG